MNESPGSDDASDRRLQERLLGDLTGSGETHGALGALLDALPDAIVVVGPQGQIVFAGSRIQRLSGYSPGELVGRPVEILVPEATAEAHVRHRESFVEDPKPRPMGAQREIVLRDKDGRERPVDIALSPVEVNGQGFVVAAVRDASERRELEQALRTALARERDAGERLRELDQMKNAFLRAVSHELRTPLTAVTGFGSLIRDRVRELDADTVEDLANRLVDNAERLQALLLDLLDIDRLTRGTIVAQRHRVDVVSLVRNVVEDAGPAAERVVVEAPECLEAHVDPGQFGRIVDNLVVNALKYSPADTQVVVTLGTERGSVLLAVDDEGPGVPPPVRASIFEPFVQAHENHHAPGTGIGLSLVRQFVQLHGGRVWVEDRPGGGSSFKVLLPLTEQTEDVPPGRVGAFRPA